MLNIEIVYARPEAQTLLSLAVIPGSTIHQALKKSTLLKDHAELDIRHLSIGIFSEPKQLSDVLQEGDRIEIYRPLLCDPKKERQRKAKQGGTHETT